MSADEIRWEEIEVEWNGECFWLHVPHVLNNWPALWRGRHLPDKLRDMLPDATVHVTQAAHPANPIDDIEPGDLEIGPLRLPLAPADFRAAQKLREIVNATADEADAAAGWAMSEWKALYDALKRAGS